MEQEDARPCGGRGPAGKALGCGGAGRQGRGLLPFLPPPSPAQIPNFAKDDFKNPSPYCKICRVGWKAL